MLNRSVAPPPWVLVLTSGAGANCSHLSGRSGYPGHDGCARLCAGRLPIVDALVSRLPRDNAQVQPASYWGDMGYQALCQAECAPGAYGCNRCDISWYFGFDALWLRREGDRNYSIVRNQFMDDVDYEFGGRITAGKMCDCSTAYEFVYTGPYKWRRGSDTAGSDDVDSLFVDFGTGLGDAFFDADLQQQRWRAEAHSFEVNRRKWAWDAISTLIGLRYFRYDERFTLNSFRSLPPPEPVTGRYVNDLENHLFGAQLGGDIFFVTSLRTSISVRGKAGVYANAASREVRLLEDDVVLVNNARDKIDLAGLFELGLFGNYQITPSIRLHGGYEVWYASGIATTATQRQIVLNFASGRQLRMKDDLFLHGFSGGVLLLY